MAKLALVHKLESDKEQQLRGQFLQAQQNAQMHKQKCDGLRQFRHEYFAQLTSKAQNGLSSAGFSHYQNFIAKIDQAIEQQTQVVHTAEQVAAQRQQLWQTQRARTEAVAKLIAKEQHKKQQRQAKAEQKILDELATSQFFARQSGM